MSQIDNDHRSMVKTLAKPGSDIAPTIDARRAALIHHTMGICGEAGELLDAIKKAVIYDKPLDYENVVEELGDIEFYMQGLRMELGILRAETLTKNMTKLAKRYPNFQYTNQRAQERADKTGPLYTTQDGPDNRDDRVS